MYQIQHTTNRDPKNYIFAEILKKDTHNELTDFAHTCIHMYFNIIYCLDTIPIHYHDVPGLHKAAGAARGSLLYYYRAQFLRAAAHVVVVSCEVSITFFREKLVEESRIV